jgi:hypothetical protein
LAKQVFETEKQIDVPNLYPTQYFTDSKDVLGWITNTQTQFPRYVASRRNRICEISTPKQWHYISTKENPADLGTRPISVMELQNSAWIKGPDFLRLETPIPIEQQKLKSDVTLYTAPMYSFFHATTRHATEDITTGVAWEHKLQRTKEEQTLRNDMEASQYLQRQMQKEVWPRGVDSIHRLPPHLKARLLSKSPFLDETDGLIKVGGRLERSDLTFGRKHPVLIPDTEAGDALVGYLHSQTQHQGRKTTTALIRSTGSYPVGGRG